MPEDRGPCFLQGCDMKISLRRTRTFSISDAGIERISGNHVVWWYGPVVRNARARSVPKAVVFFREIDQSGNLGKIVQEETALTHLGLLRIGSVWSLGLSTSSIDYSVRTFDVSFSPGGWRFVSPYEAAHNKSGSDLISPGDYRLPYTNDRNYLLDFPLADGGRLLVPCMEFFMRCYGRSAEVKRVLATYPWEEAHKRLFKPFDGPVPVGTWPVKLTRRMYNDDVIFLAHVLYDLHARHAAKDIYAQIEAAFTHGRHFAFLRAGPWFHGPAQLRVAGVPIDGGKSFLALRILGTSHPSGDTILRDRENTNKVNPDPIVDPTDAFGTAFPVRKLQCLPKIVDLTDDEEPDHGSSSLDIAEEDFVVLGPPRTVIDHRHDKNSDSGRNVSGSGSDCTAFSTGEPYGSSKGVGFASLHARAVMESEGVLRDMWNAAVYMERNRPDTIKSVRWFTFEDGFREDPEPRLIALEPFPEGRTDVSIGIRKWVYHDANLLVPRGVLVVRVDTSAGPVFLLEIQRRRLQRKDKEGTVAESEESFKGMVFVLEHENQLSQWLKRVLSQIRYVRGVVQKLTGDCPGTAHAFKHAPSADEQVPCEAAIKNALRKVGVNV
jgi:hypothetical protein